MAIYYVPSINLMGAGCLNDLGATVNDLGFKKAFVVTDNFLMSNGVANKVLNVLEGAGIAYEVYSEVVPNPTCKNVHDGLERLKGTDCDFLVSIGGGSPQDTAKAIGILATNGGHIKEYEGVNLSKNKSLPIVAVNTTAGTSSEVTINYVVTDEERHVKMVMVDKNSLATVTVNDPELMVEKPASLTAATGMDNQSLVKDILLQMTTNDDVMREIIEKDDDFVNNQDVIVEMADSSYASKILGGQNPLGIYNEGVSKLDLSNLSSYDQGCNEEFQHAMKNYFEGSATKEEALDLFYKSVLEKYPELTY